MKMLLASLAILLGLAACAGSPAKPDGAQLSASPIMDENAQCPSETRQCGDDYYVAREPPSCRFVDCPGQ
jgi:hypothetical protein